MPLSEGYVIRSSRFDFCDTTVYSTKRAAMAVIREYVREEIRPLYKQVFRTYERDGEDDGYGWVEWDASKPARLYVHQTNGSRKR